MSHSTRALTILAFSVPLIAGFTSAMAQSAAPPAPASASATMPPIADARYQFETPAAPGQNRVYWVERASGLVGACQYQTGGGPNGSMKCFEAGEGAMNQPPGQYALLRSAWTSEFGIFRVDQASGRIALCFVRDEKVVCTVSGGGR